MSPRPRRVVVEAPAKLNLGLAVGPPRPDGFHDLVTFFQSVSLTDTLVARPRASGYTLRVRHADATVRRARRRRPAGVPSGSDNLVLRAARAVARAAGLSGGAAFELTKRIPARAGLGGGSADAAAAIVAMAALHGVRMSRERRLALAAELGSDVPFALAGGTALGLGRGDRLSPLTLERPFRALIAVPAWDVPTPLAFRRFDRAKYGLTAWTTKLRFGQSIGRKRLRLGRLAGFGNSFENVLGSHRAEFEALCRRLRVAGVEGPRLTGSGSAVFGLIPPHGSASRIVARFAGGEALYVVRSRRTGVRIAAQS